MLAKIQMRRGTSAEWAAAAPVILSAGEPGYDTTEEKMKVGDGSTEWADLDFLGASDCPYEVGDILTTLNTASPAVRWPGTVWAALGGRMLIGADGTYTAGSTGGEATHVHGVSGAYAKFIMWGYDGSTVINMANVSSEAWTVTSEKVISGAPASGSGTRGSAAALGGNTNSGSTLPPYLAVYMWKRTA